MQVDSDRASLGELTLKEVLESARELTTNEDGERMLGAIPEDEDLATMDPSRRDEDLAAEGDTSSTQPKVDDLIDDEDLELLDRFEDFDDQDLDRVMMEVAARAREFGGGGLKKGFLSKRGNKNRLEDGREDGREEPATQTNPAVSIIGDVHERTLGSTSERGATVAANTTKKPLSKFKQSLR